MRKEELRLEHRELLQKGLWELTPTLSEYTFANLFLFRKVHNYQILFADELFIEGSSYDSKRFLMPTSAKSLRALAQMKQLDAGIDFLYPIQEEWLNLFDPQVWKSSSLEAESDYIFSSEKLASYSGRHLSKKRNLVKQLLEHYEVTHQPLNATNKEAARHVMQSWHSTAKQPGDEANSLDAIEHLEALKLEGEIFYCSGEPAGFLVGEALNPSTYLLHISKANTAFKGIYQYMYQAFMQKKQFQYSYCNMEQDLGIQELHHAKHSYHPLQLLKKLRLEKL